MSYCRAYQWNARTKRGAMCTLRPGHRSPNHLDTFHNVAWPVSPNDPPKKERS